MTHFFDYDTLTWPDVITLPRHTPLIIPLGRGYPLDPLAEALGHPPQIGLLPPVPFGWRGSGLVAPEPVFGRLISNLLDSLRDDGFSRVFALTPPGLDLGLRAERIVLPANSAPVAPIPADAGRDNVVLIPIGHTEQHGYHLPLNTDTLIIEALAQGTATIAQALTLPAFPYGVSTHRQAFAGTLNCGGRAFEDFWLAVVEALAERDFNRFYFLSGHGGNCSFLTTVVKYAGERYPNCFTVTAWLYLSGPEGVAALEKQRRSAIGGMGHAGELETSLMLHLWPNLVQMDKVVDEIDFITTPSYYMDWVEGGALVANPPWEDDTTTGAYGAGSLATAENGRFWLEAAIAEKAAHVTEIHQQHHRRRQIRRHTVID